MTPAGTRGTLTAYGAARALDTLEGGAATLFLLADNISATPEADVAVSYHLWAAAIRFVARSMAEEEDQLTGFIAADRENDAPSAAAPQAAA